MTHTRHILWIVAIACSVLTLAFTSCIEDGFTTSSSDVLAFNKDTVAFDTVITLQGTATKQMVVYNHSKKQIKISSIKVAGEAAKGHFHLNVDGVRGDEFQDVEIRGNDSIFIFIEARLDEMEQNEPTFLQDRLLFVTNGKTQDVVLTAWGQDVVRINGDTIDQDMRLTGDKPYLIYDTVFVEEGNTLTIDAGATLLFHDKAMIRCAGQMLANGTADEPITFRGDRLDRVVGSTSFEVMSGQWGGIVFTPPTMNNVLSHVIMKGSSIGMHCSAKGDTTQCALKLINCVLTNSAATCLATEACYVELIGTEISDAASVVAYFNGGKVMASQCTFANYYLFEVPSWPIVYLDEDNSDITVGKIKARFDNSIIYGLSTEINDDKLNEFDVYFRYCLFKRADMNDGHFINCIWDGDPQFLTVRDKYLFDYRLGNESDAIAKGNSTLCPLEAQFDRYGNDRLLNGAIDLGAYVWVPVPEDETD